MKATQLKKIVLGVAASDAHVVANHLIAHMLRERGYDVVNLGACTPVNEFADACDESEGVFALVIGTLNGHARQDLFGLQEAKQARRINCPVIVGGNLSVGSDKSDEDLRKVEELGADYVLSSLDELLPLLDSLDEERNEAVPYGALDERKAA